MENINEKLLDGSDASKLDLNAHLLLFLLIASKNGYIEIVKELLSRNANKEAKDENGWTPLMIGILLNGFFIFYSSIQFYFNQ